MERTGSLEDEIEYADSFEYKKGKKDEPCAIPMRKQAGKPGLLPHTVDLTSVDESPRERPALQRRKPYWMRPDERLVGQQHVLM